MTSYELFEAVSLQTKEELVEWCNVTVHTIPYAQIGKI